MSKDYEGQALILWRDSFGYKDLASLLCRIDELESKVKNDTRPDLKPYLEILVETLCLERLRSKPMENKLPSRERIRAVLDEGLGIDVETLVDIGQAYADGRLIEPMSREELEKTIKEQGIECVPDSSNPHPYYVYPEKLIDALLGRVGKVQEDKAELTKEVVTAMILKWLKEDKPFYEKIEDLYGNGCEELAQEIVKAMKGVR